MKNQKSKTLVEKQNPNFENRTEPKETINFEGKNMQKIILTKQNKLLQTKIIQTIWKQNKTLGIKTKLV